MEGASPWEASLYGNTWYTFMGDAPKWDVPRYGRCPFTRSALSQELSCLFMGGTIGTLCTSLFLNVIGVVSLIYMGYLILHSLQEL